jgi:predicted nucleotidyltransferase component of viral defense system
MAALSAPHWKVVTPKMQRLFLHIGEQPFSQRFYLAGGTALSLQIGHRRSVDFDFFSTLDELNEKSRNEIIAGISSFPTQVIESVGGNLLIVVDDILMGFFTYSYPLIDEPIFFENVHLASITDIGLMKCDALISRGSRKDFYDLFFISRTIQFDDLLKLGEKKYPLFRDFPLMVLESMTIFDNADRDVQPELFDHTPWDQVKQFFIDQARKLSNLWFE